MEAEGDALTDLSPRIAVATSNRFDALSDLEDDAATQGESNPSTKPKSGPKPPPIIITGPRNVIELAKELKRVCNFDFEFSSRQDSTRLHLKDSTDYRAAKALLEAQGIEHHSLF
jgi:hypothetical protein